MAWSPLMLGSRRDLQLGLGEPPCGGRRTAEDVETAAARVGVQTDRAALAAEQGSGAAMLLRRRIAPAGRGGTEVPEPKLAGERTSAA